MATNRYEPRLAEWTEPGDSKTVIRTLSERLGSGRLIASDEEGLTAEYGSRKMYRLMGGMISTRWFPLRLRISVSDLEDQNTRIRVEAEDDEGPYLGDISVRRGQRSVGEAAFDKRFRSVCRDLGERPD